MTKQTLTRPDWMYIQSAVIPYRITDDTLEILLITSRKRTRWVIPKGIIEEDLEAPASAIKEAWEEAGITGRVAFDEPIGTYTYQKWGGTCHVKVFLFEVRSVFANWPESSMRDREWVTLSEATDRVQEKELKKMLNIVPEWL
ncbi:MAG: hypothetical protein B6242_01170 [Anaerolineaceae bacterium 4572_78]|nr:MAG: hypothetical protein B6242_01170 [Anaerolineaceae bacterium 4572_78]